jgi:amyloid beta precursor protein binding protein 1
LRLWGATGQIALENSHILLINSGPGVVGVETLKNLVLPGIGNFTIQDSAIVNEADLGVNFFLEEEHLGSYRAQVTRNLLKELNPDVEGHFVTEAPRARYPFENVTDKRLACRIMAASTRCLAPIHADNRDCAYPTRAPCQTLRPRERRIHTPLLRPLDRLRLLRPWPELLQFAQEKTANMDDMAPEDHGHIPYLALLLHYLEEWKKNHDGKVPDNYKDKTELRSIVSKAARTNNPEGGEENFDEAVAAVLKSLNPPQPSSAVKEIFTAPECLLVREDSPTFWVIANAIGLFYTKYNVLPVPGSVPDMKARSADYIQLQNVYKSKARKDLAEVVESVRFLERNANRSNPIDEKDIEAFCKNAAHIKLVRGRPFQVVQAGEPVKWGDRAKAIGKSLQGRKL